MTYWIIAAIAAFFVKGLCAFGSALVFTSILSFGNNNIIISPVELLLALPSNLLIVWRERKAIDWKQCLPLVGFVFLGCIPGVLLLKSVNVQAVKVFFGVVIIALGIEMLLREAKASKATGSKLMLGIIVLLSGVLCGLFGTGAMLAAYFGRTSNTNDSYRANLCAVLLADNLFRAVLYLATGIIAWDTMKRSVILLPFMLIGLVSGTLLAKVMDEKNMKKIVIVMLILSGVSLFLTNLP